MLEPLPRIRIVVLTLGENCPDHARMLVGHGRERLVIAGPLCQRDYPVLESRAFLGYFRLGRSQCGARALGQETSQVSVSTFGDRPQPIFTSRAHLLRHQPQPGGQLPAVLEVLRSSHRRDDGARRERPNADNGADTLSVVAVFGMSADLLLALLNAQIK